MRALSGLLANSSKGDWRWKYQQRGEFNYILYCEATFFHKAGRVQT